MKRKWLTPLLMLILVVGLSSCKAQSTLQISMNENSSGTIMLTLKLDEMAASAVRDDAYSMKKLDDVLQTKKLEQAGFKVTIDENTNGDDSTFTMKKSFTDQESLSDALSVLGDKDVVDAVLKSSQSFTKDESELTLTVDLSALKKSYLDDDAKAAVEKADLNWEQYKALIDNAFSSTSLVVKLNGDNKIEKTIEGNSTEMHTLTASKSVFRSQYVLFNALGLMCFIIGGLMLWRLCRRPKLISSEATDQQGPTPVSAQKEQQENAENAETKLEEH